MADTLVDPAVESAEATAAAAAAEAAATQAAEQAAATSATTAAATAAAEAAKAAVPVVPDKYDLKLPADSKLDPTIVERTAATARALRLSNEDGQKLLDETVKDLTARETAAVKAQQDAHAALVKSWQVGGENWSKRDEQWTAEAKADPDIGGEKYPVAVEKAQQALAKYGPELKELLEETGFGSNVKVLKFLSRIGHAMAEPTEIVQGKNGGNTKKTDAQVLYPSLYNDDGTPKG